MLYNLNTSMLVKLKGCVIFVLFGTWAEILMGEQNYRMSTGPPFFLHKWTQ
jgi:hypothetical protein